jgi:hypothetical protein
MTIDFNDKKNDKINKFFDFLEEVRLKSPAFNCDSHYYAQYKNLVRAYLHSKADVAIGNKLASLMILLATEPCSQKYIQISAKLETNKEFTYIYIHFDDKTYIVMRNANGEIFQIDSYHNYPPNEYLPISKEVRNIFQILLNSYYVDDLPSLDPHRISEEALDALTDGIKKIERKSKFTVIENNDPTKVLKH